MPKRTLPGQLGLFDIPASSVSMPPISYREALLEQIIRDELTLRNNLYSCPGRDFYEQRIVAYRETLATL